MSAIVRVTNAIIYYDNGDKLQVQANGDGRYRWALIREGPNNTAEIQTGEEVVVAEKPDAAGIHHAMVGAAAMHVKSW